MKKNVCPCCRRRIIYGSTWCFGCGEQLVWFSKDYFKKNIEGDERMVFRSCVPNADSYMRNVPISLTDLGATHRAKLWPLEHVLLTMLAAFIAFILVGSESVAVSIWLLFGIFLIWIMSVLVCRRILPAMQDEVNYSYAIYPYTRKPIFQDTAMSTWLKMALCKFIRKTFFFGLLGYSAYFIYSTHLLK